MKVLEELEHLEELEELEELMEHPVREEFFLHGPEGGANAIYVCASVCVCVDMLKK